MNPELVIWSQNVQAHSEAVLSHFLQAAEAETPATLLLAMRYSTLGGGKRIRAMLAMAAAALVDSDEQALAQAIAAVEMAHAGSLIHDDLPCMDDDDLRRGKASCHIAFNEATALLAGTSLQVMAVAVLLQENGLPAKQRLAAAQILSDATGCNGMMGGQQIDLQQVGNSMCLAELETMHRKKTGALIEASLMLGLLSAKGDWQQYEQPIRQYAHAIGLAFQVVDDVLDAVSTSETLGKTVGKDQQNDKPTFVSLLGIDGAQDYAQQCHQQAMNAVSTLGENADKLRYLADFVLSRTY